MSLTRPAAKRPIVTAGFRFAPLIGAVMTTPANTTNPKVRLQIEDLSILVNKCMQNFSPPDLYKVGGRLEVEGAAAPQQDDEERADELRDECGQDGHGAGLLEVVDPEEGLDVFPLGRHACLRRLPLNSLPLYVEHLYICFLTVNLQSETSGWLKSPSDLLLLVPASGGSLL